MTAPPGGDSAVTISGLQRAGEGPILSEPQAQAIRRGRRASGEHPAVFAGLKWTSFTHSCVYLSLLICAFALGKPQPATFVLGLTHGLLWIFMSLACLIAVRMRIVPLRLAVAVAVLGGIGPFFGSYEFVAEQRRRRLVNAEEGRSKAAAAAERPR
jgi:hypothetical protein